MQVVGLLSLCHLPSQPLGLPEQQDSLHTATATMLIFVGAGKQEGGGELLSSIAPRVAKGSGLELGK